MSGPQSLRLSLGSLTSVCFLSLMILTGSSGAIAAGGKVWHTDYDQAVQQALEVQRPLLVHFYGDSCPPCRRMERDVLNMPETVTLLTEQFVAVKVNAGQGISEKNIQLVHRFGVHSLPCDVILDPQSGRVLSQAQGYQDLSRYLSSARTSLNTFDQSRKTAIVRNQERSTGVKTANEQRDQAAMTSVELGDAQPIIGLEGFSPVKLIQSREWIRGQREFAFEYKGITYYLTNAEELARFRSSPEDFAPRLLGCDPVILWESDRAVPGDTAYGAFFDGELYLFASDDSRAKFKSNPPKYTRIQHVLKVEHIQRTAMR